ncbi:TolC family protein [Altererythrobacter salegens]|uniref:TolC family protein n=1 Tax=Croceibacterium salegens TaxID=1737568 RepID=A0A6I4SY60_9SPHN|nr:TolC family protein [Croceibacterium salegens]MXO60951.1 TolC family protein [Croceibacterium salegens]
MRKTIGGGLLVALLTANAVQAQQVTYDEALNAAVSDQPLVRTSELRLEARREVADAADELPDPRIRTGLRNIPITGPDAFDPVMMTMFEVGIEQEIPNLAERRARAGLASADIEWAAAELSHARHMARIGAGQAWIALAFAQRSETVASEALVEIARTVPLASSSVAAGNARPGESLEVRRAVLEVEDALTRIQAEEEAAQARLARYIAIAHATASGEIPSADVDERWLRSILEYNPEIILADAQVLRAEAAVDMARSELRPDFSVGASYGVRDGQYGDLFSVMGTVTLPLFRGRRQEPRISAASSEAASARQARADMLRALEARFEEDLAAWRSAYRQWQRATEEMLPLAESRVELERASFAAGRAELLDVIDAIKALALLRIEILNREQATVAAAVNLRLTYTEHER